MEAFYWSAGIFILAVLFLLGVIAYFDAKKIARDKKKDSEILICVFKQTTSGWVLLGKEVTDRYTYDFDFFSHAIQKDGSLWNTIYTLVKKEGPGFQHVHSTSLGTDFTFYSSPPPSDGQAYSRSKTPPHLTKFYLARIDGANCAELYWASDDRDALQRFFFSPLFWERNYSQWAIYTSNENSRPVNLIASGFGPRTLPREPSGNLIGCGSEHPIE